MIVPVDRRLARERNAARAGWARRFGQTVGLTAIKARAPGLTRGHVTVYIRDTDPGQNQGT